MTVELRQVPPGPAAKYERTQDLLVWMIDQFHRFGDIYKASVCGSEAYMVNDPRYVSYRT